MMRCCFFYSYSSSDFHVRAERLEIVNNGKITVEYHLLDTFIYIQDNLLFIFFCFIHCLITFFYTNCVFVLFDFAQNCSFRRYEKLFKLTDTPFFDIELDTTICVCAEEIREKCIISMVYYR